MLRHPRRNLRGLLTVRVVLFVKFRVRRRPLFVSGGMAKPEGGGATEISRRLRQRLEAGRGIDDANRRQAILHAAGFVVERSATPST